jgi:hypothetical protein
MVLFLVSVLDSVLAFAFDIVFAFAFGFGFRLICFYCSTLGLVCAQLWHELLVVLKGVQGRKRSIPVPPADSHRRCVCIVEFELIDR